MWAATLALERSGKVLGNMDVAEVGGGKHRSRSRISVEQGAVR